MENKRYLLLFLTIIIAIITTILVEISIINIAAAQSNQEACCMLRDIADCTDENGNNGYMVCIPSPACNAAHDDNYGEWSYCITNKQNIVETKETEEITENTEELKAPIDEVIDENGKFKDIEIKINIEDTSPENAGITPDNWILYPFDKLTEKLTHLFIFSEITKVEYNLKLAEERDYEILDLQKKALKAYKNGNQKKLKRYSKYIAKTNEMYNKLLDNADWYYSKMQDSKNDNINEEVINELYEKSTPILDRHEENIKNLNLFGLKAYLENNGNLDPEFLENIDSTLIKEGRTNIEKQAQIIVEARINKITAQQASSNQAQ